MNKFLHQHFSGPEEANWNVGEISSFKWINAEEYPEKPAEFIIISAEAYLETLRNYKVCLGT